MRDRRDVSKKFEGGAQTIQKQSCQSGSGFSSRVQVWILKNYRASIGPDAGAKLRFLVSDRVFTIAEIKLKEDLV